MSYRKYISDEEDSEHFRTWLSFNGYGSKKVVDDNWTVKELGGGKILARVVKKFDKSNNYVSDHLPRRANFEEFSKLCKKHKLIVLWDPKKAYFGYNGELELLLQNLIELCLSTKPKNSGGNSEVKTVIGSGLRSLTSTVSTILEPENEWSDMIEHLQQCQQGRALDLHIINRGIKCVDGRLDYLFDGTKKPSSTAGRYCLELWQNIENMRRGPLICYLLLKAQVYLGCSNRREEYDSTFLTLLQWLCHNPRLISDIPFTDVFQQLQKLRAKLTPETDFIVTIICMTHETLTTNTNTKAKEMWYNFQLGRRRVDYRLVFSEVPSFARIYIDILASNMFPKLQVLPDQVPDLFYQLLAFREILSEVNLENVAERLAAEHLTEDNFSSSIAPLSLCGRKYSLIAKLSKKLFEQHYAKKSLVESVFSTFSGFESLLCKTILNCYVSALKENIRKMRVDQFMVVYPLMPEGNVLLVQEFIQHNNLTSNELKSVIEGFLCVNDSIGSLDRMKSILTTLISKSKDYADSFLFIPLHCTEYSKMFEPFENILLEINNHLREFFKQHRNGFNQMFTKICSIKREEKEFGRLFYLLINNFLGVYFETQMTGGSSLHNLLNIMGILEKVQSRSSVHLIVFNSALMACSKHIRNLRSEPYVYIRTHKGIAPFISTWKNTKSNDKSLIAQQYNNAFEQYIRSIYAELIEDVTMDGELLLIDELLQLRKNLPKVVELCNAIDLNSHFDVQVKNLHNELQEAERTHKGLSTLLNWLREHQFGTLREISDSPLKPIENTKTSLGDLREMIQETERRLAAISETKDDLLYFIERESLLFQAVLRTKLSNRETSLRTLNNCIRETALFISALFDNDQMIIIGLEDVNIEIVIRHIRQAKRTLENELSIICKNNRDLDPKLLVEKLVIDHSTKGVFAISHLALLLSALCKENKSSAKKWAVKIFENNYGNKVFVERLLASLALMESSQRNAIKDCYASVIQRNIERMSVDQFVVGCRLLPSVNNETLVQEFMKHNSLAPDELKIIVDSCLSVADLISSSDRMKLILGLLISKSITYSDSFLFISLHCPKFSHLFESLENTLDIEADLINIYQQYQDEFNQIFGKVCTIEIEEKEFGKLFHLLTNSFLSVFFGTQMTQETPEDKVNKITQIIRDMDTSNPIHAIVIHKALMIISPHIRSIRYKPYFSFRTGEGLTKFISLWNVTKNNQLSPIACHYSSNFEQYVRQLFVDLIGEINSDKIVGEELVQLRQNRSLVREFCDTIELSTLFEEQAQSWFDKIDLMDALPKFDTAIKQIRREYGHRLEIMSDSTKSKLAGHMTLVSSQVQIINSLSRLMIYLTDSKSTSINFSDTMIRYAKKNQVQFSPLSDFEFLEYVELKHIVDLSEHILRLFPQIIENIDDECVGSTMKETSSFEIRLATLEQNVQEIKQNVQEIKQEARQNVQEIKQTVDLILKLLLKDS